MLFSVVAIVIFTIFKRYVVCEVFLNIFISLVGGAFLSMATALVAFCAKRKEHIITYCTEYKKIFDILLDVQNWYTHWSTYPQQKPTDESIKYVLQKFEDIHSYNNSKMWEVLDDYCSLDCRLSMAGNKMKEMMQTVEKVNYQYNADDSRKFSLYRVHTYDETYMYKHFIKAKISEISTLFLKLADLQAELLEITKINDYLIKINKTLKVLKNEIQI